MEPIIKLKEGYGDLRFGMPVEDVVAILGTADSVENIDNAADEPTTVLHYEERGLTLFFEEENPVLACIDVCDTESTLYGQRVFDFGQSTIVDLVKKHGFSELEVDDEDWGERRVSFPEADADFFFDDDELVSVTLGA